MATCLPAEHPHIAIQMARSMITVLMCTLLVSAVLLTDLPVSMGQDDGLGQLVSNGIDQYQQQEAISIETSEELQKNSKQAEEGLVTKDI